MGSFIVSIENPKYSWIYVLPWLMAKEIKGSAIWDFIRGNKGELVGKIRVI